MNNKCLCFVTGISMSVCLNHTCLKQILAALKTYRNHLHNSLMSVTHWMTVDPPFLNPLLLVAANLYWAPFWAGSVPGVLSQCDIYTLRASWHRWRVLRVADLAFMSSCRQPCEFTRWKQAPIWCSSPRVTHNSYFPAHSSSHRAPSGTVSVSP